MRTTFVLSEAPDPSQAFALVVLSIMNLNGGNILEGECSH
jgi:hypothetical protein